MCDEKYLSDKKKALFFDIYRTIVLGCYIAQWGMPEYRTIVTNEKNASRFEVYTFPNSENKAVFHFATIGVGFANNEKDGKYGNEYFMVLPPGLGGATVDDVVEYMTDLCAHFINNSLQGAPRVLDDSLLAPVRWKQKSLLVDEALGENECFSDVAIGERLSVEILWLVPIYQSEATFILSQGIEKFDELKQNSDHCIVDFDRPAYV